MVHQMKISHELMELVGRFRVVLCQYAIFFFLFHSFNVSTGLLSSFVWLFPTLPFGCSVCMETARSMVRLSDKILTSG